MSFTQDSRPSSLSWRQIPICFSYCPKKTKQIWFPEKLVLISLSLAYPGTGEASEPLLVTPAGVEGDGREWKEWLKRVQGSARYRGGSIQFPPSCILQAQEQALFLSTTEPGILNSHSLQPEQVRNSSRAPLYACSRHWQVSFFEREIHWIFQPLTHIKALMHDPSQIKSFYLLLLVIASIEDSTISSTIISSNMWPIKIMEPYLNGIFN